METSEVMVEELEEGTVVLLEGEPSIVTSVSKSKGGKSGAAKVNYEVSPQQDRLTEPVDATIEVVEAERQRNPVVRVGTDGHFEPAVVRVSTGSTVLWQWTGEGGTHQVTLDDGLFESDPISEGGYTVSHEFTESGVYPFVCKQHEKRGLVVVEES